MNKLVDFIKALGEETRIKIILMLCEEELCVCELMEKLNLSQSAVSHHMKILKQADLVNDRRNGKWIFYSLNKEGFEQHGELLKEIILQPVAESSWDYKLEPELYCKN